MKYTNWLFFLFEHFPPIFQELVLFRAIRPEQNKAIWQECESSLHAQKNSSGKAANLSLQRRLFEPQRIVPTAHRRCLLDCIPHLFSPFPLSTTLVFRTPRSHVPPKTDTQCHALDHHRRRRRRRPRVLPLKYSSSDGVVVRRPRDGQLTSCGENLA